MSIPTTRIAVVTGANKGIGFWIVKGLCKKFDGHVYLTARNEKLGHDAVKLLENEGLQPKFHQLDINCNESIKKLREYLLSNYGGLDILVNNAAIAYFYTSTASLAEKAENTVKTNYFGTLNVCDQLFPLLRPNARVVNISSSLGKLCKLPGSLLRAKFSSDSLSKEELKNLMSQYVEDCKNNVYEENGWPKSCYNMSKIGLNALTFIQQREFNNDPRPDIVINAVHPGYIGTDMTNFKGPGTPEEGAEAPVYCTLLPPKVAEPKGDFVWFDKTVQSWI